MVTVTESFFFRNPAQFRYLNRELLPALYLAKKVAEFTTISIWSAGCSTGEEAYSLAYMAADFRKTHPDISIELTATDINLRSLEYAKNGCYRKRSFRTHYDEILAEYKTPLAVETPDGMVIEPAFRPLVDFQFVNLRNTERIRFFKGVDVIFCRNVLIYFDEKFRRDLVGIFHFLLEPGGYLFLGETESLPGGQDLFELVNLGGAFAYRKAVVMK